MTIYRLCLWLAEFHELSIIRLEEGDSKLGVVGEQGMSVKVVTGIRMFPGGGSLGDVFGQFQPDPHPLPQHHSLSVRYRLSFTLDYQPGDFTITVEKGTNALATIHLNDVTYPSGRFGFYNFSQDHVLYSASPARRCFPHSYTYDVEAVGSGSGPLIIWCKVPTNMSINATDGNGLITWFP